MSATIFTNVRLIDGSGDDARDAEVFIQGNRIMEVGAGAGSLERGDAEVIDGGGATLMPGLVESHAHPSFGNTASLESAVFQSGEIVTGRGQCPGILNGELRRLDHGFRELSQARTEVGLTHPFEYGYR